jgi:hypothetical protein
MVVIVLLAGATLAACDTQSVPKVGHDCGTVQGISDPDEAEKCFWQAYVAQPCAAATLTYIMVDIDLNEIHTITIQPKSGGCAVADTIHGSRGNMLAHTIPLATYSCASLQQRDGGGLVIASCGKEGDIAIPARPTDQVGHVCGTIDELYGIVSNSDGTSPNDIEKCFWQAYTTCKPSTLLDNVTTGFVPTTLHTITIQPAYDLCAVADSVRVSPHMLALPTTYPCTGLIQRNGGLVVTSCGAFGDIIIPPQSPHS